MLYSSDKERIAELGLKTEDFAFILPAIAFYPVCRSRRVNYGSFYFLESYHCKIYKKERGKFIFDVFTPQNYEGKKESNGWYLNQGTGFWRPETHICLESHYIYEDNIRLDQYVIINQKSKVDVIRI